MIVTSQLLLPTPIAAEAMDRTMTRLDLVDEEMDVAVGPEIITSPRPWQWAMATLTDHSKMMTVESWSLFTNSISIAPTHVSKSGKPILLKSSRAMLVKILAPLVYLIVG